MTRRCQHRGVQTGVTGCNCKQKIRWYHCHRVNGTCVNSQEDFERLYEVRRQSQPDIRMRDFSRLVTACSSCPLHQPTDHGRSGQ